MDVKTTFLNNVIEEEVYIEQPPDFETRDNKKNVYRLKKSLYGLKQAPRVWYRKVDGFLTSLGFTTSKEDSNLYYNQLQLEGSYDSLIVLPAPTRRKLPLPDCFTRTIWKEAMTP